MISIAKKYRSPDQIVTLATAWLAGAGAVLLLAGSMMATQFTKMETKEGEVKNIAFPRSFYVFGTLNWQIQQKQICHFNEKIL